LHNETIRARLGELIGKDMVAVPIGHCSRSSNGRVLV
jgi:hypothetical protein